MPIESLNPATGELIERFDECDDRDIDRMLDRSTLAFEKLGKTSFADRAVKMSAAADLLESEKEDWARIATEEMGKTLTSAVAEIGKCASVCRYYAEYAETLLADIPIATEASRSFVRHLPLGPVLAVMPWNFPFWQVFRFAAPALMAGNTALLKHASNVPRSAIAIEAIFKRAGFPNGAFGTLLIGSDKVERVLNDERVRAVTLTGSEAAGRAVAAVAGKTIKPSLLELGGSDPFIVMPSADVDAAIQAAVTARTMNNGQSCIAAKRFIVHQEVYDRFAAGLVEAFEKLIVGDPLDPQTDIGPLATPGIRDELDALVRDSVDKGAVRLCGAEPIDGPGNFYRPGILAEIPRRAPVYSEEVFGPVAMLFKVSDLDEAIDLANATRFGLGSSIWTTDDAETEQATTRVEAGATFVNAIVASDPRLPFGGVKQSGYGRELSRDGIVEFVNRKTVYVA